MSATNISLSPLSPTYPHISHTVTYLTIPPTLTHTHSPTDTHAPTLTHRHSRTDTHPPTLTHRHSRNDTHPPTLTHTVHRSSTPHIISQSQSQSHRTKSHRTKSQHSYTHTYHYIVTSTSLSHDTCITLRNVDRSGVRTPKP